jgi:hypothetical protein
VSQLLFLLSGGFARGYRTYILSALGVLTALAGYAIGDQSAIDTFNAVWQALASLSVGTAASKIDRYLGPIDTVIQEADLPAADLSDHAFDVAKSLLQEVQGWRDDPANDAMPADLRERLDGFLAVFGPRP